MSLPKYIEKDLLFAPGHTMCAGCGQALAIKFVISQLGKNTILVENTGCSEVTSTKHPYSSWGIPYIHTLFENASSVASGIWAGLKKQNKTDTNVVVFAGDGSTYDIGTGQLSGMMARGDNILYVCFDNEGYMNTGYQYSTATALYAHTSTSPSGEKITGNLSQKKDMVAFALAHKAVYVGRSSISEPMDIQNKIKKALSLKGSKYIEILCPCVPGWKIKPNDTIDVANKAVLSGIYPLVEYINGKLEYKKNISTPIKVIEYLKIQGRYKHILKNDKLISEIQDLADENLKFLNNK